MKKIVATSLSILIATSYGCSAFRSSTQTVNIQCNAEDAILMANGQRIDNPSQIKVKRNRNLSVQCSKEGYHSNQQTISSHFNGTGALDAVGTVLFLLPGVGLFTPGAWSLDKTNISMSLYEKNSNTSKK